MYEFLKLWIELKTDKRAVTALEYALIAAAVGAVMVVGAGTMGNSLSGRFAALAVSV